MDTTYVQETMQQEGMDCWLIYDFQGTNPIMSQVLQTPLYTSRRLFLMVPARGEPQLLGSKIDQDALRDLPYHQTLYTSWPDMETKLGQLLAGYQVIGMDYSPNGALPTASRVDAGTVEQIKNLGKQVVTAANVYQAATAMWNETILEAHLADAKQVAQIKDEAFSFIADRLRGGGQVTEYEVQQLIIRRFKEENLMILHAPIVGVNEHSSDPHYMPNEDKHAPIKKGDWILIDLWAKRPEYSCVFADMTFVGLAGSTPSAKQQEVFEVVKGARDRALGFLQEAADRNQPVEGWQVDDATRAFIEAAGYGDYFFHRTGHSLSPGDNGHGSGVNLDNLESHDTRRIMPGIGFSIEPGIYLPEFGVRLEINVYMTAQGPQVTTPLQAEIICLDI